MMTLDRPVIHDRDAPSEDIMGQWRHWFLHNIGSRYQNCTLESYVAKTPGQVEAVNQCRDYFERFSTYAKAGRGLIFIGPPGTGKDHLLIATMKQIMERYLRCKIRYRDGLSMIAELRCCKFDEDEAARIVDIYAAPSLLCLSDPIPPKAELEDAELRAMYRIIDRRYREQLPTCATLNVASRADLDLRMGPQSADRLCERAIVVKCNWESFRKQNA